MTAQIIFENDVRKDLTDIIFERRNKAYGAYELRKHYDERMSKSMLITLGIFVSFFFSAFMFVSKQSPVWKISGIKGKPSIFKNVQLPSIKPLSPVTHRMTPIATNPNNHNFRVASTIITPTLRIDSFRVANQRTPDIASLNPGGTGSVAGTGQTDHTPDAGDGQSTFHVEKTPTITIAENMPKFPGGEEALQRYLAKHIRFTNSALDAYATGKIYISFVVDVDGTISDIKVIHDDMGHGCAQNAIDVIQNMPTWTPGSNNGHEVRVQMVLPITYQTY